MSLDEKKQKGKEAKQAFPGKSSGMGSEAGMSKLEYFSLQIYCAMFSDNNLNFDEVYAVTKAKDLLAELSKES